MNAWRSMPVDAPLPLTQGNSAGLSLGSPSCWDQPKTPCGICIAGRYRIESLISHGGQAAVYRGHQIGLGRDVAIKLIRRQRDQIEVCRFMAEAQITSQLKHPNILKLFDFGETSDGLLYFVTELLEGETLRERLLRGPLSVVQALGVMRQVCAALQAAHALGVTHRDVKPANIFISCVGRSEHIQLLDFGIAKVTEIHAHALTQLDHAPFTSQSMIIGTPGYIAPEIVKGEEASASSDIYSLGVVGYECLAGRQLFKGSSPQRMIAAVTESPTRFMDLDSQIYVDPRVEAFVMGLLTKTPGLRPRDCFEVIESIDLLIAQHRMEENTSTTSITKNERNHGLTPKEPLSVAAKPDVETGLFVGTLSDRILDLPTVWLVGAVTIFVVCLLLGIIALSRTPRWRAEEPPSEIQSVGTSERRSPGDFLPIVLKLEPPEQTIRIDGIRVFFENEKRVMLKRGMHVLNAWHPGYRPLEKSFRVTDGRSAIVEVRLDRIEKSKRQKKPVRLFGFEVLEGGYTIAQVKRTIRFMEDVLISCYHEVTSNRRFLIEFTRRGDTTDVSVMPSSPLGEAYLECIRPQATLFVWPPHQGSLAVTRVKVGR